MQARSTLEIKQDESSSKNIHKYDTIKSTLNHCAYNTFVVFDLDNTLVESTQELGSDQWFTKLMEQACQQSPSKETVQLVLAIYDAVQHHTKMQAVENETVRLVNFLQDLNIPVIALTARGNTISIPTLNALKAVGLYFDKQWGQMEYVLHHEQNRGAVLFKDGVIFCSGKDKGKSLDAFFRTFDQRPAHVLMVDDKEHHLTSVQQMVEAYKGKFTGIHYSYLDEKIKTIDMQQADKQLQEISHRFPPNAKNALAKIKPGQAPSLQNAPTEDVAIKTTAIVSHPFFSKKSPIVRRNSCPNLSTLKPG